MKKFFAILLVSMFGFAFGCGGAAVAPESPEAPAEDVLAAPEAAPEQAPEVAEDAEAME
jgi:hypothetical protein